MSPTTCRLLWALRDVLGMTGTKFGCGMALCGACTIHIDGAADALLHHAGRPRSASRRSPPSRRSATRRPARRSSRPGSRWTSSVRLLPVRPDHVGRGAAREQSRTRATRTSTPRWRGNICRCGTYPRIRAAIKHARATPPVQEADHAPDMTAIATHLRRPAFAPQRSCSVGGCRSAAACCSASRCRVRARRCGRRRAGRRRSRRTPSCASTATGKVTRDHAAGRDGAGHLHVDADADRRRARGRPGQGRGRACAARRQALCQPADRRPDDRRLDRRCARI